MRIQVFGAVRIHVDGTEVDLGPIRRRSVLALLLAARGRVVGVSDLLEAVWGDAPAASAMNQLHRQVGEIRRLFEPGLGRRATGSWLSATPNGYRLDVSAADCDLTVVTDLTGRARTVDRPEAHDFLRQALHMADQPPFADAAADIADHPLLTAVRRERIDMAVLVMDTADRGALSIEDIATIQLVAADARLNEPLQAALAGALATTGRRAEALALLDRTRRALRDELGLDPSETLRAAHQAVLADIEPPRQPTNARPAQLPPRVLAFSDRPGPLQALQEHATADASDRAVVITALGGMAGVGKTALAVDWAHRLAPRYSDGQLYLNLRGFDPSGPPMTPHDALDALLESVGANPQHAGESVEARGALFRSLLAGRRMLLVLDNARDSAQVEPLLPGTAGSQVIITSRNRLIGLVARHNALTIQLDRMGTDASRDLLVRRLGAARVSAEPTAVADLITACAGLPLALAIVAARAAVHHWESLRSIADDLAASTPVRLDALSTGEADDVRAAFSWSYAALSEQGKRVFRVSAAHPGPEVPVPALSTMTGLSTAVIRQLLVELATASMINRLSTDRFTMHDLLRAYAGELLNAHDERLPAESRLIDHYRHAVRAAYLAYGREPFDPLAPNLAVTHEAIADPDAATTWYATERSALYTTAHLALSRGRTADGTMIILDARPMSMERDLPSDLIDHMTQAAEAAATSDHQLYLAELLRTIGIMTPTDPQRGIRYIERAGVIFDAAGDHIGRINTQRSLALHWGRVGDLERSARHARQAVDAATAADRPDLIATANTNLGEVLTRTGELAESDAAYHRALQLATDSHNVHLIQAIASGLACNRAAFHDWPQCYDIAQWGLKVGHGDSLAELALASCVIRAAAELDRRAEARHAARRFRDLRTLVTDEYIEQYVGSEWESASEVSIGRTETLVAQLIG